MATTLVDCTSNRDSRFVWCLSERSVIAGRSSCGCCPMGVVLILTFLTLVGRLKLLSWISSKWLCGLIGANQQVCIVNAQRSIHFFFWVDFMIKALWMCGMTPPPAIVALIRVSSSSSPLMASCKCLGVILLTLRSFEALPASSRTSAVKYSRMAAL